MNGWWPYLLLVIVLAAPVIGMILRNRVIRGRGHPVQATDPAEDHDAAGPGQS